MELLTDIENKELSNKERSWYLKSDLNTTWLVTKKGVYSLQEVVDILNGEDD